MSASCAVRVSTTRQSKPGHPAPARQERSKRPAFSSPIARCRATTPFRTIVHTSRFKRDYKREGRNEATIGPLLAGVVDHLIRGERLPDRLRDHALFGKWKDYRDCHLKPDLVLIYQLLEGQVVLIRMGSHAELFG